MNEVKDSNDKNVPEHVLLKNMSQYCKDKGLEWNHQLTVYNSFPPLLVYKAIRSMSCCL
jgi:hypothetical protein